MKKRIHFYRQLYLTMLLLGCALTTSQALEPSLQFDHLTRSDGLSQVFVNSVAQDRQGFIWIGTQDGLNRYDGYDIKVYRHDPTEPNSLSDNHIRVLYPDAAGNLWIGTSGGLNRYDPLTDSFQRYRHQPDSGAGLSDNDVFSIFGDSTGHLWVGTRNGLNRFDPDDKRSGWSRFYADPDDTTGLSHNSVRAIGQDAAGNLWIGTHDGLNVILGDDLNSETPAFRHFSPQQNPDSGLAHATITAIDLDREGRLWIGTRDGLNRLAEFDPSTHQARFISYQHQPHDPANPDAGQVFAICQDHRGDVWIGTFGAGLSRWHADQDRFSHYRHEPDNPFGLSDNLVLAICEDRSGLLWISTATGVSRLDLATERFAHFQPQAFQEGSLSHHDVFAIYEDTRDVLWVGTFGGGLNRSPLTAGRQLAGFDVFRHDPANPNSLSHDRILSLGEDRQGNLWIGTFGGGLDRLSPAQRDAAAPVFQHFRHDPTNPSSLSSNDVFTIYEDSDGQLWIGTLAGLNKFQPASNSFQRYIRRPDEPGSISHNNIRHIVEDTRGTLWIGTLGGGLNKIPAASRTASQPNFVSYRHDPDDPHSLSHDFVMCVFASGDSVIWVGTYGGGLNKFDPVRETFRQYRERDGLANDAIYGIVADAQGMLWLSTNHGLSCFDPRTEQFTNFNREDGLQANEFSQGAFHRGRGGRLYFGGIHGFNMFDPAAILPDDYQPPVVLTDFLLFNAPVAISDTTVLTRSINQMEQMTLRHTDYIFSFEFAALGFRQTQRQRYAYILEGFDRDWLRATAHNRMATYTNIPPGNYVFKVKATNHEGQESPHFKAIRLTILPPWWKTWWAYAFYALTLIGLFGGFMRYRIEARTRELKVKARIEQAKSEERARVRKKSSADFHDEAGNIITKINLFTELARRNAENDPQLKQYLGRIQEHVRLLSGGMRDFIWVLDPDRDTLFDALYRLEKFGNSLFEHSSVRFETHTIPAAAKSVHLSMDERRAIVLIFKEAMNNCLKYAQCQHIRLVAELTAAQSTISLIDDGQGFDPATASDGYGLRNMTMRSEAIGGNLEITSQPGVGTRIVLKNDFSQNHPFG